MGIESTSDGIVERISAIAPTRRPSIAIVVNCFNYEDYVGAAIQSVLGQEHPECEILVVDDGSTDRSWEVIRGHKVNAIRTSNAGQTAACLLGLEHTIAPFVLFLDADDELKPGSIETILAHLDPQVAKLQFPLTRIDAEGTVMDHAYPSLETFRDRDTLIETVMRSGVYTSPPTSGNVFRRDVALLLRDATYDTAVDGMILFAAPFFGDVVSLSEPLGIYRLHNRNKSGLGRALDPAILENQIDRFVGRIKHLSRVVAERGETRRIPDPEKLHYFQERMFTYRIAKGERPTLSQVFGLIRSLGGQPAPIKNKAALGAVYLLAAVLPLQKARVLMDFRLNRRKRPINVLLQQLAAAPPQTT